MACPTLSSRQQNRKVVDRWLRSPTVFGWRQSRAKISLGVFVKDVPLLHLHVSPLSDQLASIHEYEWPQALLFCPLTHHLKVSPRSHGILKPSVAPHSLFHYLSLSILLLPATSNISLSSLSFLSSLSLLTLSFPLCSHSHSISWFCFFNLCVMIASGGIDKINMWTMVHALACLV